ncbi:hypothetical protein ACFL2T_02420, partial [Elusimicrobiota bacterium]
MSFSEQFLENFRLLGIKGTAFCVCFTFLALWLFWTVKSSRSKQKLRALADYLFDRGTWKVGPAEKGYGLSYGAKASGLWRGTRIELVLQELREFSSRDGHGIPSSFLDVFLECPAGLEFIASRESMAKRAGKRLGLIKDVETGDPQLDKAFVFKSQDPEALKQIIRKPEFKAALLSLLEDPFFDCLIATTGGKSGPLAREYFAGGRTGLFYSRCATEDFEELLHLVEEGQGEEGLDQA